MSTSTIALVFVDINEHKSQYYSYYYFAQFQSPIHINITSVDWDSNIGYVGFQNRKFGAAKANIRGQNSSNTFTSTNPAHINRIHRQQ